MISKQKLKDFTDNHVFSTIAVIISSLFAIFPCLICFITFWLETKLYGLLFFVPTLIVAFICYLSNLCKNKYSKLVKTLAVLINIFIIFIGQTFFAFGLFLMLCIANKGVTIDNLNRYNAVLRELGREEKIAHFPKQIPNDITNTVFFKESCVRGGDIVYLRFIAPKEYIENEIKKFNYVKIEGPFDDAKKYESNYPRDFIFGEERNNLDYKEYRNKIEGYKIYVIGDKSPYGSSHPCEYGIAVNDKTNTIIYYASNPD